MKSAAKWQVVLAIVAGLAAGGLIIAASYFVIESATAPTSDPQRQKHRLPAELTKPLGFNIPVLPQYPKPVKSPSVPEKSSQTS